MSEQVEVEELAVLFPDASIRIGEQDVSVKELRFGQQIKFNSQLAALADDLSQINGLYEGNADSINAMLDVIAQHFDAIQPVILASCEQSIDFDQLTGDEGEALLLTWWSVNKNFFVRRLVRPKMIKAALAGDASLPLSSDTDISEPNSATTQQDN
ncbi:DUF6631 family protein [Pseudomonas sp. F1_0610]|uniref:DUF6631 family protein n=1 Tax=Pseudomonas sp. F1_0610 TaxID=3114284 RepID=UPI0039C3E04B